MIEDLGNEDCDSTIDYLVKNNLPEKNLGKLAEECAELLEVLLKCMTRGEGRKPKREKIVEELGDVMVRAFIYIIQNNMDDEVSERMKNKLIQLQEWIDQGKYKGGV